MLCCEVFVWCVVLWKMLLCCEKFLLCCEIFCVEVWQIHATYAKLMVAHGTHLADDVVLYRYS